MDEDITTLLNNKLNSIKEEYVIKMLSMQFYRAFLLKYQYVAETDGEELITDFILRHITLIVQQDDDKPQPDQEWQDYFIAYVSSCVYDFEIVNDEAIADLIQRRYTEYKWMHIDQGETIEKAWEETFRKEYTADDDLLHDIGPMYKEFSSRVYRDAIRYLKENVEYFSLCSPLEDEEIIGIMTELFSVKNKRFTSLFHSDIPMVITKLKDNKFKLNIPNLILACVEMFVEYQSDKIIVHNCTGECQCDDFEDQYDDE